MRKLLAISVATAAPVLLATTLLVAGGGNHDSIARKHDPAAAAPTTTSVPSTTAPTAAPPATVPAVVPAAVPAGSVDEAVPATATQSSPEDVAAAVFDAWLQGDDQLLRELATDIVADFLAARRPHEPGEWSGPSCDSGMGSTYCAWNQAGVELVVRVRIEAAAGRDDAVVGASFSGSDAIWPFTTSNQAVATQTGVDQGHQPWLLDPASVATHFAQAELGWPDAQVQQTPSQTATYDVTDPASGARSRVTLAQPLRHGPTGLWAVVRAEAA